MKKITESSLENSENSIISKTKYIDNSTQSENFITFFKSFYNETTFYMRRLDSFKNITVLITTPFFSLNNILSRIQINYSKYFFLKYFIDKENNILYNFTLPYLKGMIVITLICCSIWIVLSYILIIYKKLFLTNSILKNNSYHKECKKDSYNLQGRVLRIPSKMNYNSLPENVNLIKKK